MKEIKESIDNLAISITDGFSDIRQNLHYSQDYSDEIIKIRGLLDSIDTGLIRINGTLEVIVLAYCKVNKINHPKYSNS